MQIQTYDTTLTNAEQTELQRALDLEADGLFDDGNTARPACPRSQSFTTWSSRSLLISLQRLSPSRR